MIMILIRYYLLFNVQYNITIALINTFHQLSRSVEFASNIHHYTDTSSGGSGSGGGNDDIKNDEDVEFINNVVTIDYTVVTVMIIFVLISFLMCYILLKRFKLKRTGHLLYRKQNKKK